MGAGLVGGRIGHTRLGLFWVFSNFLLGVLALFSVILSLSGLWSLRRTISVNRAGDLFLLLRSSVVPLKPSFVLTASRVSWHIDYHREQICSGVGLMEQRGFYD